MAIGVVAFAFVSMLGLISSGMSTFRKAMDASVTSQIYQRMLNDAQQTDFNALVATEFPELAYFDDQGNKLSSSEKAKAVYHVKMRVQKATVLPGSNDQNTDLVKIIIQIANNPGNLDLNSKILDTNSNSPFYKLWQSNTVIAVLTHSAIVARNTSLK